MASLACLGPDIRRVIDIPLRLLWLLCASRNSECAREDEDGRHHDMAPNLVTCGLLHSPPSRSESSTITPLTRNAGLCTQYPKAAEAAGMHFDTDHNSL